LISITRKTHRKAKKSKDKKPEIITEKRAARRGDGLFDKKVEAPFAF